MKAITTKQDRAAQTAQNLSAHVPGIAPPAYGLSFIDNSPVQRRVNNTGLPDRLKSGVESLSGIDMSDVKVHYNSSQPAQLNAHAYAQGNQIHIAPGQQKYLPHEAWHVVQQKQGRVRPTKQMKGRVNVNDDSGLEKEADEMGARSLSIRFEPRQNNNVAQLHEQEFQNLAYRLTLPVQKAGDEGAGQLQNFLVEDSSKAVAGQMKKDEFLDQLNTRLEQIANPELARIHQTTRNCPYLDYWIAYYKKLPAATVERGIRLYTSEALNTTNAHEVLSIVCEKVLTALRAQLAKSPLYPVTKSQPDQLFAPGGVDGKLIPPKVSPVHSDTAQLGCGATNDVAVPDKKAVVAGEASAAKKEENIDKAPGHPVALPPPPGLVPANASAAIDSAVAVGDKSAAVEKEKANVAMSSASASHNPMLHGPRTGFGSGGASAAVARDESSLHDREDLWMHSASLGELQEMMGEQYILWPALATDLLKLCAAIKLKPDSILDCGKLTIPVNLTPSPKDFQRGEGIDIGAPLRSRIADFLMAFMRANGQLGYIQSQEWFTSGLYSVVIEVNFYPERGFSEAGKELGVHKDTDSRNLFVNLIFNNLTDIPGTEWTMDEALPDERRLQELLHFLPKKEVMDIMNAKQKMASKGGKGSNIWEGGVAPGPHTYTSWVDELYWHATPAMHPRPAFDGNVILQWLAKGAGGDERDRLAFYEAMLVVLRQGKLGDCRPWLQKVLTDLATWETAAAGLRAGKTERAMQWFDEISHAVKAIDWHKQKKTGGAGFVEVRDPETGNLDPGGRGLPTTAAGRPRANSDPNVQAANFAAIAAMKKAQASAAKPVNQQSAPAAESSSSVAAAALAQPQVVLPKRSFIRTWVTIVRR